MSSRVKDGISSPRRIKNKLCPSHSAANRSSVKLADSDRKRFALRCRYRSTDQPKLIDLLRLSFHRPRQQLAHRPIAHSSPNSIALHR
jgi:hypothetical protein